MTEQLQIRRATEEDCESLAQIEQICFPRLEAAGLDVFWERLVSPAFVCYIGEWENKTVGFINGARYHSPALPDELYRDSTLFVTQGKWQTVFGLDVLPDYRNRGFARQLLQHLIEQAKQAQTLGVVLTCKDPLRPFYESCGFEWQGISNSSHGNAVWNDMKLAFSD